MEDAKELLLRARTGAVGIPGLIRAAIEFLDQLYQYGQAGRTTVNELGQETFTEEEEVPAIEEF